MVLCYNGRAALTVRCLLYKVHALQISTLCAARCTLRCARCTRCALCTALCALYALRALYCAVRVVRAARCTLRCALCFLLCKHIITAELMLCKFLLDTTYCVFYVKNSVFCACKHNILCFTKKNYKVAKKLHKKQSYFTICFCAF